MPLDDSVQHLRPAQGTGEDLAAAAGGAANLPASTADAFRQIAWFPKEKQLPLIQQENLVAQLSFIQIRRAPHNSEALPNQFVDHLPQLASCYWVHPNA